MRKFLLVITFLSFSISGWAQRTRDMSHEGSSGDVFIGYSLLNGDTLSHASGWEAALTGNLNDWFGLKADLGGNYKSTGGVGAREYNILFGPQLMLPGRQAALLCSRIVGRCALQRRCRPQQHRRGLGNRRRRGLRPGLSNFAFRPVQLDYHGAHVFSNTQKDARYSVGLVYRFK